MAATDHIACIGALLDALDRHDGEALARYLHDDVAYDDGLGGRVIGAAAVREALIRRAGALDERHGDRVLMQAEGRVAAEVTLRGRHETALAGLPEPSGRSYSLAACLVFEIEGERVARLSRYLDSRGFLDSLAAGRSS